MKQKNLILVAVAVGCGLVAAFLTSQIGAKSAAVEQVEIPVAAKELPIGTKLSKEQIDTFVTYKKFSKDSVPASYVSIREDMFDKRLVRTIRAGEPFDPKDLTLNAPITPPAGFNMMTFHATPEKGVAGFAGPGSRVDILCSVRAKKTGTVEVFPLLLDMLVLAIDANIQGAQQGSFQNMSMCSLAVNNTHARLLHAAINRGADLRLILRNTDQPAVWDKVWTEEEIWAVLKDQEPTTTGVAGNGVVTVKLPVPVEDLPAGTELTPDVIEKKFKLMEISPPAPIQFTLDLKEHSGRYLLKDLAADQFVPRSALGEKNQQPKPGPDLSQAPTEKTQPADPTTPKVEEKPVYWHATIQTANGVKKYRYRVIDGEYRYEGEVKDDGSVAKPAKSPNQVTPPATPAPETKPEGDRTI